METTLLTSLDVECRKRALLVESNVGTQRLCRHVLERSGFVVDTVASGIQAVVSARNHQPDLILMDLQLPDVPCRQAVDWLRSNPALRSTPIVVLNGASGDGDNFADDLPVTVVPRPLSAQSLQRAIERASTSDECSATD
jgi:two-component system cell cycle response regulator DivK